jgi:hypothetical protein
MTLRGSFDIWRRISNKTDTIFSINIIIGSSIACCVITSVIISNEITDLKSGI